MSARSYAALGPASKDHSQYCEATGPVASDGFVAARVRAIQQGLLDTSCKRSHSPMTPCPILTINQVAGRRIYAEVAEPAADDLNSTKQDSKLNSPPYSDILGPRALKLKLVHVISQEDMSRQHSITLSSRTLSESSEQWRVKSPNDRYFCHPSDTKKGLFNRCNLASSNVSVSQLGLTVNDPDPVGEHRCDEHIPEANAPACLSEENDRPCRCQLQDRSLGAETTDCGVFCRSDGPFKHRTTTQNLTQSQRSTANVEDQMNTVGYFSKAEQLEADVLSLNMARTTAESPSSFEAHETSGCFQSRHSLITQQHHPDDQIHSQEDYTLVSAQVECERNLAVTEWQHAMYHRDHYDARNGHPDNQTSHDTKGSPSNALKPVMNQNQNQAGSTPPRTSDLRPFGSSPLHVTPADKASVESCVFRRHSEPISLQDQRSKADNKCEAGQKFAPDGVQPGLLSNAKLPMQEDFEEISQKSNKPAFRPIETTCTRTAEPNVNYILTDPTKSCSRAQDSERSIDPRFSLADLYFPSGSDQHNRLPSARGYGISFSAPVSEAICIHNQRRAASHKSATCNKSAMCTSNGSPGLSTHGLRMKSPQNPHRADSDAESNNFPIKLSSQTANNLVEIESTWVDSPTSFSQDSQNQAQRVRTKWQGRGRSRGIRRLEVIVRMVRE